MFSQQYAAFLQCVHTHCNCCWQLVSPDAAYIITSTVTSKGRFQESISPVSAQGRLLLYYHPSHCQGGLLYTQCQNGCHAQHHVVCTLTHILRFEYIVNTSLHFAFLLFATPLYILQYFTFCGPSASQIPVNAFTNTLYYFTNTTMNVLTFFM